jgi:hypothetical protein
MKTDSSSQGYAFEGYKPENDQILRQVPIKNELHELTQDLLWLLIATSPHGSKVQFRSGI